MASSIRQKLAALVISLAFLVISLPVTTHALLAPPEPNLRGILVITDGIRTPAGIALDASDGSIFVADTGRQGIIKFNKFGVPVMFFNTEGVPQRVAVAKNGNGSVIVAQGKIVAQYNNNGVEAFKLRQGTEPYPFKFATGVAVHPGNGNIYVVDAGANKACVFDSTGSFTGLCFGYNDWVETDSLGNPVTRKLELPTDIQISSETTAGGQVYRVYIIDPKHKDLQIPIFSDAGVYEKSLCQQGAGAGNYGICQLDLPMSITFDYSTAEGVGRVYVSDPYQASVMAIDPAPVLGLDGFHGNFRSYIGSYGTAKGELVVPTGIAFDRQNGRLIVANGYGNLTIYPIDAGRNPINRDSLPPIFDIDYISANNVSNSTFVLTGTREPADDVKVHVSINPAGAKAGETTYPTPSTWSCTITGLTEGRNVITAVGTDPSGNSSKKSVDLYFTRPVAGGVVVDPYPPITASSTYTFTGTIASGASVTTNPPAVGGCTYPTTTTWTCPVPLGTEGTNSVSFIVGETTTIKTIVKDTLAPSLQLYALGSGDTTTSQVQNIMGTVDDANLESITVKVNNNAAEPVTVTKNVFGMAATKGVINFPVLLDQAGANTVLIEAKDKVGNTVTDNRTISLNMAAPAIAITQEDGKVTRQASLTITGSVVPSSATCTINGTATPDIGSANVSLTQGFNNIVVACSDGVRTSKVKRTVYFDSNTLEVAVASPNQDVATKETSVTLTGAVDAAASLLIATIDGETHAVPVNNGQFTLTTPLLQEKAYSVNLTAVDGAGNITSTTTRSVVADMTPPALAVNYAQSTPSNVLGTVEPGAKVTTHRYVFDTNCNCYISEPIGTVTMGDAGGNGTFSAAFGQNYDLFSVVVSATDQAGLLTTIGAAKPDGDCTHNGSVSADDASICLDMVAGIRNSDVIERAHCDVGPLSENVISPNGQIDITDCILVMRKAAGLPPVWW